MDQKEILKHVDHTQLRAFATWEDIQKLCEEAIEYETASVCIPPCYIKRVHDTYGEKINICTVVGFPLGYSVTEAKAAETKKALEDIRLFRENIGPDVKMKAAGGVKTVADMEAFLEAGCDRIGTSSAIQLIQGEQTSGY